MEFENENGLNDLDALASEAECLEFKIPGAAPAADTANTPSVETAVLLLPLFSGLFTVITPAWNVTQQECKVLSDVWAPVIDKYFPSGLGVEGTAIMATVAILGPRFKVQRKAGNIPGAAPAAADSVLPVAPGNDPDGTINGQPVTSEKSESVH